MNKALGVDDSTRSACRVIKERNPGKNDEFVLPYLGQVMNEFVLIDIIMSWSLHILNDSREVIDTKRVYYIHLYKVSTNKINCYTVWLEQLNRIHLM